jgi:hypothetical protein
MTAALSGIPRRRLPGRARPAGQALSEWRRARAEWIRTRSDPEAARVLAPFLVGEAEHMHRWRVQLDCGHFTEVIHPAKDKPAEAWQCDRLLPGEFWCDVDECYKARGFPVWDIASWDKRLGTGTWDDDPEEVLDYLSKLPPAEVAETWERIRRPEPREYARWRFTLSCGHKEELAVSNDVDWEPAHGVTRRPPEDDWQRERRDWLVCYYEEQGDKWGRRFVEEDFPEPTPWTTCFTCPRARKVSAYQYVGPLVPPPSTPQPPRRPTAGHGWKGNCPRPSGVQPNSGPNSGTLIRTTLRLYSRPPSADNGDHSSCSVPRQVTPGERGGSRSNVSVTTCSKSWRRPVGQSQATGGHGSRSRRGGSVSRDSISNSSVMAAECLIQTRCEFVGYLDDRVTQSACTDRLHSLGAYGLAIHPYRDGPARRRANCGASD